MSMESWENNVSPEYRASLRANYLAAGPNWSRDWNVWVALDTYLQVKKLQRSNYRKECKIEHF